MTARIDIDVLRGSAGLALAALLLAPAAAAQSVEGWQAGGTLQLACAPRLVIGEVDQSLTLIGSQEGRRQSFFGPHDTLVIGGGSDHGVAIGQEYFVRRLVTGPRVRRPAVATAGWVRIVAVDRRAAIAQVVDACDGMRPGDYLAPAVWPDTPAVGPRGAADYDAAGQVIFTPDARRMVGEGQYAVIDLGAASGLAPGQRLTAFRQTLDREGPITELAEAIAVLVEADHTTIRIIDSRDAVLVGDLIAPQR